MVSQGLKKLAPLFSALQQTTLIDWVREYGTRDDEYGLKRHRKIFEEFNGRKKEYTDVSSYQDG